jgi:hypothetical protein
MEAILNDGSPELYLDSDGKCGSRRMLRSKWKCDFWGQSELASSSLSFGRTGQDR